ncbi:hypothetical protein FA95DRAFT_116033 [Auriscalpium vulgare]|uniref:Uncharacterized protein n=1 Tax=Auriscalpium vulgare TaxID=40419 RepID=A0ACB8RNY7_9AGAM|nr:hypothetical protein FA95DRAFT_116033 [Auriscalpium vulgare]
MGAPGRLERMMFGASVPLQVPRARNPVVSLHASLCHHLSRTKSLRAGWRVQYMSGTTPQGATELELSWVAICAVPLGTDSVVSPRESANLDPIRAVVRYSWRVARCVKIRLLVSALTWETALHARRRPRLCNLGSVQPWRYPFGLPVQLMTSYLYETIEIFARQKPIVRKTFFDRCGEFSSACPVYCFLERRLTAPRQLLSQLTFEVK